MNGLIILLGAPNDIDGTLSSIAIERCEQAIMVYRQHPNYRLLLTGGYGEHFNQTNKPHAYYISKYLISKGIPKEVILSFVESANTVEDARLSKPIIEAHKPKNIILVTSDFHGDRAQWLFEKELPNIPILLSCSKTELPQELLTPMTEHEIKALQQLKISYY